MKLKRSIWFSVSVSVCVCVLWSLTFSSCLFEEDLPQGAEGIGNYKIATLQKGVCLATWNTQTFFDAVEQGTEYPEFKNPKSGWNEAKYIKRLDRLVQVIQDIDADVFVLQEIEHEGVVQDIGNRLDYNKSYPWSTFVRQDGDAIGSAMISRLPIVYVRSHQTDLSLFYAEKMPALRPMIEVGLSTSSKVDSASGTLPVHLIVLICHWKSKYGGEEKSEKWRNAQEAVCADLVRLCAQEYPGVPTLVIGDLNRNVTEFVQAEQEGFFAFKGSRSEFVQLMYSPWPEFLKDNHIGSYYYQNNWEQIDHIFLAIAGSGGMYAPQEHLLKNFKVYAEGSHVSSTGIPYRYNIFTGDGYSDHFPLSCVVQKNK